MNGWAKFSVLKDCELKFSMFLAFLENFGYYFAIGLGAFNIFMVKKVILF